MSLWRALFSMLALMWAHCAEMHAALKLSERIAVLLACKHSMENIQIVVGKKSSNLPACTQQTSTSVVVLTVFLPAS